MSNDLKVREKELIDALEFYGIKTSTLDKVKDMTWLTKENAKHFLDTNKREKSNRYFSVIKNNQHKLELVKPLLKTSDLQMPLGVQNAVTHPYKTPYSIIFDSLVKLEISLEDLPLATDVVWLKRRYAKISLVYKDREDLLFAYNVVKSNLNSLPSRDEYSSHISVEDDSFIISKTNEDADMRVFRSKIRKGLLSNTSSSEPSKTSLEDFLKKYKTQPQNTTPSPTNWTPAFTLLLCVFIILFFAFMSVI